MPKAVDDDEGDILSLEVDLGAAASFVTFNNVTRVMEIADTSAINSLGQYQIKVNLNDGRDDVLVMIIL